MDFDDEYHDLTDSEDSSSSTQGYFKHQEHLVLELHDLKKDAPEPRTQSGGRIRKHKKKKRKQDNQSRSTASSSSSVSKKIDESKAPEQVLEKFYDAVGSFHGLQENKPQDVTSATMKPLKIGSDSPTGTSSPNVLSVAPVQIPEAPEAIASGLVPKIITAIEENTGTAVSVPSELKTGAVASDRLVIKTDSGLTKEIKGPGLDTITSQLAVPGQPEHTTSSHPSTLKKPVERPSKDIL